jgi:hypothetical protein
MFLDKFGFGFGIWGFVALYLFALQVIGRMKRVLNE